jgi:hypothetical protein
MSGMKVTIYDRMAGSRVARVVPPSYRPLLPEGLDPAQDYSVLLFAHTARDVVPSAAVRRGLRRLGTAAPGGIVAVGTVFTAEARALLDEQHAVVVAQRRGRWNDESARERQL